MKPVAWMHKTATSWVSTFIHPETEPDEWMPLYTHPVELTDEEIKELWAESHEDGIAMQQGFTTQQHYFAHLILRKAQKK
jgi:hypothetical protein